MNEKKVILVFGAGINQLELIREAKKLGLITIAIDPVSDPPGKYEADYFYQVDGKDYETTRAIAKKHNVNGIVTGQMEKPMRLMARLASEFGFIFHTPEVVERSLDKWLMKEAFLYHGVPCARGKLFKATEEISLSSLKDFTFPLIIKPRDAFSSRGVYKVDSITQLKKYIDETRSFSSRGDVIVEEFLEGKEFSVESITFRGKTTVIQITEKFITPYPNTVEVGHLQPAPLNEAEKSEISGVVTSAIRAIGVDNSASHAEVMVTKSGVKMIEIGARLGGDFIASYLTYSSTGVSMDKAAVQVALGMEPDLFPQWNKYALIRYLLLPYGKIIKDIKPFDDLLKVTGVVFIHFFFKPGDTIQPVIHSALRPACYLVSADHYEECVDLAKYIENELVNRVVLE